VKNKDIFQIITQEIKNGANTSRSLSMVASRLKIIVRQASEVHWMQLRRGTLAC
jgi:hypothetical protein